MGSASGASSVVSLPSLRGGGAVRYLVGLELVREPRSWLLSPDLVLAPLVDLVLALDPQVRFLSPELNTSQDRVASWPGKSHTFR